MRRLSKGVAAQYNSLEELAQAYRTSTLRRTKDEAKLAAQREKFLGKCRVCGEPLALVGGNVLACKNDACKGFAVKSRDDEGNEIVTYRPVFRLLDEKAEQIASNLFD